MARAHFAGVFQDPVTGAPLRGATVTVRTPGTVNNISATMFADGSTGTTVSNPITSDVNTGYVEFYLAVAQEVDLFVQKTGYADRTYSNIPVIDDAANNLTALLTTTGDLLYASGNNTPARLAIGGNGTLLVSNGSAPTWTNTIPTGGLTISAGGITVTGASTITGTLGGLTGLTIASGTFQHNGNAVGFYGTSAISKPTVAGSRGANAALASLLTNLALMGLITDSSS